MSNQSQPLLKPPSFPKRAKNREKCEEIRWNNHDILLLINLPCLTYLPLEMSWKFIGFKLWWQFFMAAFMRNPLVAIISICRIAMLEDFKLSTVNRYPPLITSLLSISLQEFSGRVMGMKVDAVDTTGAGDAFVAGILSQLATDLSLLQVTIFFVVIFYINLPQIFKPNNRKTRV
jgi:hypothetical protein